MATKKELECYIEELARVGDEICELIEGYENDPVISSYLTRVKLLTTPLWMKITEEAFASEELRKDWDKIIGELQREGLYQADLLGDKNVEFASEKP